jgi:hypothetical protein
MKKSFVILIATIWIILQSFLPADISAQVSSPRGVAAEIDALSENGFNFRYGRNAKIWFKEVQDTASDDCKGYSNILPGSIPGKVVSVGVKLKNVDIMLSGVSEYFMLQETADILQTSSISTDDVDVESARLELIALSVEVKKNWFTMPGINLKVDAQFGFGFSSGYMEFYQTNPNDPGDTKRKIGFDNYISMLGISMGWDNFLWVNDLHVGVGYTHYFYLFEQGFVDDVQSNLVFMVELKS